LTNHSHIVFSTAALSFGEVALSTTLPGVRSARSMTVQVPLNRERRQPTCNSGKRLPNLKIMRNIHKGPLAIIKIKILASDNLSKMETPSEIKIENAAAMSIHCQRDNQHNEGKTTQLFHPKSFLSGFKLATKLQKKMKRNACTKK
jgi:hypothetical protein